MIKHASGCLKHAHDFNSYPSLTLINESDENVNRNY